MLKYDFGCGNHKVEGCIGIDLDKESSADIFWDLTIECPFLISDSADYIISRHVLEHIPYPKHLDFFAQILRVLKVGGRFEVMVPHPGHDCAMVPDHKHWFTVQYINDVFRPFPNVSDLSVRQLKTPLFDAVKNFGDFPDDMVFNCFRNVASEIVFSGVRS